VTGTVGSPEDLLVGRVSGGIIANQFNATEFVPPARKRIVSKEFSYLTEVCRVWVRKKGLYPTHLRVRNGQVKGYSMDFVLAVDHWSSMVAQLPCSSPPWRLISFGWCRASTPITFSEPQEHTQDEVTFRPPPRTSLVATPRRAQALLMV